jgi:E3 ubiquitin-protein ligase BAH
MERYFPKETREKQKANEVERGKELFGDDYEYNRCSVM